MRITNRNRHVLLTAVFLVLSLLLYFVPSGYEERTDDRAVRCRGEIVEVDDAEVQRHGMVRTGSQDLVIRLLDGPFAGRKVRADNKLMGRMDLDKLFQVGDAALVVLTLDQSGGIVYANAQDHYRLRLELLLLGLFALLLLVFGGWTGARALLSFVFAGLMIWKVVVPGLLKGYDPVLLSLAVVGVLTGAVIFLVGGLTRKGLAAFLGAFLGILTSCGLAVYFTDAFHLHGAVLPFAETLLYSGFGHLDLAKLYSAAVFFAASGAVMDLAMDVAASMQEVREKNPDLSRTEMLKSGMTVGRAVVGTMTTTLLFAYSGGYITLLMAFMAQGVPLANMFNLIYVAAEVLKTLIGSFGLVTVAPFTAVVGALIFSPAGQFSGGSEAEA
jgi:uncharacterized membrane protein